MHIRRALLSGLVLLALAPFVRAGEEFDPEIATWACRRAEGRLTIDGKLDEADWERAAPIRRFYHLVGGVKGNPDRVPEEHVEVRVLYDKSFLYVGAKVRDPDIIANPDSVKREKDTLFLDGDVFEVFLQPDRTKTVYYELHVNPLGATWDARMLAKVGYMRFRDPADWKSGLRAGAVMHGTLNEIDTDEGWSVEMAIPLWEITDREGQPYPAAPGNEWRVSFCLYDYAIQYDDADNGSALMYLSSSKMMWLNFHNRGFYDLLRFE